MNTFEPQARTAASLLMYDGMTWVNMRRLTVQMTQTGLSCESQVY